MKLIDKSAILYGYQKICNGISCLGCPFYKDGCALEKLILDSAAVDAEPVVKCKDCSYAHMTYGGECKYCDAWEEEGEMYLDGDFYCAFGERKDDLEKGEVNDWRWMR